MSGSIVELGKRRFELRQVDPTITKALCQHHFKGKLQLLKRWEPIWKSKVLKKRALSGVWQPSQPTFFFCFLPFVYWRKTSEVLLRWEMSKTTKLFGYEESKGFWKLVCSSKCSNSFSTSLVLCLSSTDIRHKVLLH